jgi:hypothetical protein
MRESVPPFSLAQANKVLSENRKPCYCFLRIFLPIGLGGIKFLAERKRSPDGRSNTKKDKQNQSINGLKEDFPTGQKARRTAQNWLKREIKGSQRKQKEGENFPPRPGRAKP